MPNPQIKQGIFTLEAVNVTFALAYAGFFCDEGKPPSQLAILTSVLRDGKHRAPGAVGARHSHADHSRFEHR